MGHGLGAQKDFKIPDFAQRFLKQGIAVVAFDYRTFGGSDGEPRQVISVSMQLDDWTSTLKYIFSHAHELSIDEDKVAIWGSSFGGGLVLAVAAKDEFRDKIKGVISQVPFVDGFESLTACLRLSPVWNLLKGTAYSIKDIVRRTFGLNRQYIPLLGSKADDLRLLFSDDSYDGYNKIIPKEGGLGGWKNQVSASIVLEFPLFRPTLYADQINAKVLLIAAENDLLCPVAGVTKVAEKLKKKRICNIKMWSF